MKKSLLLMTILLGLNAIAGCVTANNSTPAQSSPVITASQEKPFSVQDYREVLQQYVSNQGLVDYIGLQADRTQLDRFNQSLGNVSPETYASWPEQEKIAFLINAYNALTLQSIIDQQPLKESIRDISGVWNRRKFPLAGAEKTLDNIEHDILRKDFNEPRIHVALVCAAMSCPILRNEPYTAASLDQQLDEQTVKFANSPHGFRLDQAEEKVYLSSIFKWYGKDFEKTYGNKYKFNGNDKQRAVLNYLNPILNAEDQKFLAQEKYKVKYLDYDWSLNQQ